jgi:hypothetical protein
MRSSGASTAGSWPTTRPWRTLGFTRARITQIVDLLLLASEIQAETLFLELPPRQQPISERALRRAVLRSLDRIEQRRAWEELRASLGAERKTR